MRRLSLIAILALVMACNGGKDTHESEHGHSHGEAEGWGVTAWGDTYEIFAECGALAVGDTAVSHTHVTVLGDFSPLRTGSVSAVLRTPDGTEAVFTRDTALRDGIFSIAIVPAWVGEFALLFRVESEAGTEEIPAGRVRVGHPGHGEGLIEGPPARSTGVPADAGAETASFLKEQQWRTAFRTAWAASGEVFASVRAPATIRAASGAEVLLTAPLDGVVTPDARLFAGREVKAGEVLLSLAPRASSSATWPELEAETSVARARLSRLEDLLELGAVSQGEVEAARARLAGLESRLAAAKGSTDGGLEVRAPFSGRVAEAHVVPGAAVNAGDPLVRLVRTPPVWIEVSVVPREAARLRGAPAGVSIETAGVEPVLVGADAVRLVSVAPEIDRATGTVAVMLEVREPIPFPLGSSVTVEILLAERFPGVVLPAGAIVDDGGAPVVYVQTEGETFERRPVRVTMRQGGTVLLDGVGEGERIVVVGGAAIRRASLLSSGEVEGHVH